jgi:hypothetical protein
VGKCSAAAAKWLINCFSQYCRIHLCQNQDQTLIISASSFPVMVVNAYGCFGQMSELKQDSYCNFHEISNQATSQSYVIVNLNVNKFRNYHPDMFPF